MSAAMLLLLAGCGADVLPPLAPPSAEIVARVASPKVGPGEPVALEVVVSAEDGWDVQPGVPVADGLTVTFEGASEPLRVGDRAVTTWRYSLTGPDGSYVIDPGGGSAAGPGGDAREVETPPIFVDIGVAGPTGGPMADLLEPPPPEPLPWGWIAGGTLAAAAVAAGVGYAVWRWGRVVALPPPPDPPHVVAVRAWAEVRAAGLDDHAQALSLSRVLRVYLEAITGWPATARTTREITGFLERERALDATNRPRAARVLDATDRLKFAREGGGEAFFSLLDEDFAAVIRATAPEAPADA